MSAAILKNVDGPRKLLCEEAVILLFVLIGSIFVRVHLHKRALFDEP
jgi:hypothetical protein